MPGTFHQGISDFISKHLEEFQLIQYNSVEEAKITLAERDRGRQLVELARNAEQKKKHIPVDHIGDEAADFS